MLTLSLAGVAGAAGANAGHMNVDVGCRCPDPVGQSFCADFKKQIGASAAYQLVDNTSGFGLGVHFTCIDMWKGLDNRLAGHMSAISVAFTIYADTLPGEMLEDNSVFRVGVDAIPQMARQVVSALGQIVTANASVFDRLRAASETSGASAGGAESPSPSPAPPAATPSAAASSENPAP